MSLHQSVSTLSDPFYDALGDKGRAIVIDNGSWRCRVGYNLEQNPRLVFPNLISKVKKRDRSENNDADIVVGSDVSVESLKYQLKSPFERNLVVNQEVQEWIFDYAFAHLGLEHESRICHPVVFTEPPANPAYCRQLVLQLLFECYRVPKVSICVDDIASYRYNTPDHHGKSGIIVSSGNHSTHVIPILNGSADLSSAQRINIGGNGLASNLQKLLQLKFPAHSSSVTWPLVESMIQSHCYTPMCYNDELNLWSSLQYYDEHCRKIQLPYDKENSAYTVRVRLEEEEQRERSKRDKAHKVRVKKLETRLSSDIEKLNQLVNMRELIEDDEECLAELGYSSINDFNSTISLLSESVDRAKENFAFINGKQGDDDSDTDVEDSEIAVDTLRDVASYYQLLLGVERIRVSEALFSPEMLGVDQCGVAQAIQNVISRYDPETQSRLASDIFLTGGSLGFPGMSSRIESEVRSILPFGASFQVRSADNMSCDAWRGASLVTNWVTKEEYEEHGDRA